jgi:hypothetical protein
MKKYEILSSGGQVPYTRRYEIVPGCTFGQFEYEPNFVSEHRTLEEALRAFRRYDTMMEQVGHGFTSYITIVEFFVIEKIYDEEFDIWEPGELHKISPIVVNVYDKRDGIIMETFDNFFDAEQYMNSLEGQRSSNRYKLMY